LNSTWKNVRRVDLRLPKALHVEQLQTINRVALLWGPLVLAGERERTAADVLRRVQSSFPVFLTRETAARHLAETN